MTRKFRVLCKYCNSYLHTKVLPYFNDADGVEIGVIILCTKCGNRAENLDEEL
jgi:RNase P subunit RPR2